MRYRNLGRTGLSISPLVLGTVNFSWLTDEPTSFAVMDRALELGINAFDTSDNYNAGHTEALIGRWFALGGDRRERIVLASKAYSAPTEWGAKDPVKRTGSWVGPNDRGLSARHIRAACEASLTRLRTDHIDLYQMHHIDRATPWDEIWQAMELLIQQGKVIYVGSSNFAGWHIAAAQENARGRHRLGLASEQSVYNLKNRTVELEVIPACRHYGVGFLPYSPLASGVLGGRIAPGEAGRRAFASQAAEDPQLERYLTVCRDIGEAPADVALAWVATRPGVTATIAGPRTVEQLEANAHAIDLALDEATSERLDEIFPGPGGAAPEAYAW